VNWLLLRASIAAVAMAAGAVLGSLLGWLFGAPWPWALAGALLAVVAAASVDALRGHRFLRWVAAGPREDPPRAGGLWGELAYHIDRALRAREQAIEDERQRLQQFLSAIEASPNGVILLDAEGLIDWCNAVAADHFRVDPVRDRGQLFRNLVRTPAFLAYLQAAAFQAPLLLPEAAGRRTLSVTVRPYGDGQRLVLSQDVTERERADAMRRDFVANVSHEIRTPLTVLAGFVETLAALPLTEVERKRVLVLMEQQTDRMRTLVSDLLTLAQLEGSPRPAADRWLSVPALLERARADAALLSAGRHALVFSGGEQAEIAGADTELLSAIGNLVNNAVRYTPEGGRIEVRWSRRADGGAELDVIDTGVGIAREHLPRLTERFYRVDSSRSRDTGGTGLGLSIVKHVVQRHGGEIDIQSEPGKGSTFRLLLPPSRVRRASPALPADTAVEVLS
jgi:two-component system phosphate regulon sensor histidine kinase PhoR